MSVLVPVTTYPMKARKGRTDGRAVLVAQCHAKPADFKAEALDYIEAANIADGEVHRFDDPAEFWRWVWRHRSILLVLGDADRDMALAGGPGHEPKRRPFRPQPRLYMADYRGSSKNYGLTVVAASNWHPEGIYATEKHFGDLVTFVRDYVDLVRNNDLGPRLYPTLGGQALHSYRRQIGNEGGGRLRHHGYKALHRFEYRVKSSIAPIRISPEGEYRRYKTLFYADFRAFYLTILAQEPMPAYPYAYWPEGMSLNEYHWHRDCGSLFLAHATIDGQPMYVATPQLDAADSIEAIHEAAAYRVDTSLSRWAERMFNLRESTTGDMRRVAKALGVALWGRLCQQSFTWREPEQQPDYQPGDERLYGAGEIYNGEIMERFTAGGRYEYCDPAALERERFHAVGAHVLACGRMKMAELMKGFDPSQIVYAHTDSLWTTVPHKRGHTVSNRLGSMDLAVKHDIEFIGGLRLVDGVLEAAPGVGRVGTRRYHPHESTPEGVATYEVRG